MLQIQCARKLLLRFCLMVAYLVRSGISTTCGATFTNKGSGVVTSPLYPLDYPNNISCEWVIDVRIGSGVRLEVEHLNNMEFSEGKGRCYDKLLIYTVDENKKGKLVQELCAQNVDQLPSRFIYINSSVTGRTFVLIKFKSDYAIRLPGFSISFKAMCDVTLDGANGVVTSPGYPFSSPGLNCTTKIRSATGTRVEMKFVDFDVKGSHLCVDNYLSVISPTGGIGVGTSDRVTKYCGNDIPIQLTSYSNQMTLTFKTDSNSKFRGFKANWTSVSTTTAKVTSSSPATSAVARVTSSSTLPTTVTSASPSTLSTGVEVIANATVLSVATTDGGISERATAGNPPLAVIVKADDQTISLLGKDNRLQKKLCSQTISNYVCQRWDKNLPHEPNFRPSNSSHNYCGIPDDDVKPWCYTTDPDKRWEYCDVSCSDSAVQDLATTSPVTSSTKSSPTSLTTKISTIQNNKNTFPSTHPISEERHNGRVQSWIFVVIALSLLLLVMLVGALVWRRRRSRKHGNYPNDDNEVILRPIIDDPDIMERPRENTYVEIPFISAEEMAGNGINRSNQRRNSNISVDTIDAAKRGLFEDNPHSSRNNGVGPSEEHPYSMAIDGNNMVFPTNHSKMVLSTSNQASDTELDNPYQQIDYVRTEDVADLKKSIPTTKASEPNKKSGQKKKFLGLFPKKTKESPKKTPNASPRIPGPHKDQQPENTSKPGPSEDRKPQVPPKQRPSVVSESSEKNPPEEEFNPEITASRSHYQCPTSIKDRVSFCNDIDPVLPAEYASTSLDAAQTEKLEEEEVTTENRIIPDDSLKVSINPMMIDRTNGSIDSDQGWYAVPTSPTFELSEQIAPVYDNPSSRPSERSSSGDSYCQMNKIPSDNKIIKKQDSSPKEASVLKRESGMYMQMQSQPSGPGIHYQNLSYDKCVPHK